MCLAGNHGRIIGNGPLAVAWKSKVGKEEGIRIGIIFLLSPAATAVESLVLIVIRVAVTVRSACWSRGAIPRT